MKDYLKSLGLNSTPLKISTKWNSVRTSKITLDYPKYNTIEEINSYVNKTISYKSDNIDYWQTPDETLSSKTGDCEDYVILKRAMLKRLGIDSMMLVGFDVAYRINHAILLVDDKVLDNVTDKILKLKDIQFIPKVAYGDDSEYLVWRD